MGRAFRLTGNDVIFSLLLGRCQLITDGSGRTYFRACLAETAVNICEQLVMQRSDVGLQASLMIIEDLDTAKLVACAHAAAAEHAAVHVVDDERIGGILLKAFHTHLQSSGLGSDILDEHLQFAVAVLGTCRAVFRMSCQKQFERKHAKTGNLFCLRMNDHPILRLQGTGCHDTLLPFQFNDAHPAGSERIQILVMTQVGNVDTVLERAVKDIGSVRYVELYPVNGDNSHINLLVSFIERQLPFLS